MNAANKKELGLIGLTALVFSTMVGGGIFNIPQNMAATAGSGAVALAWLVTGVGVLFLVMTFKILADKEPDLNAGIYEYAEKGFGNYAGFNIAWGYWLCVALGNVSFAVMLNDAFGSFFPILHEHGLATIVFGMLLIWGMYSLVIRGLMLASNINTVMSCLKCAAIILIIISMWLFFKAELWKADLIGPLTADGSLELGDIGEQIKNSMLVTMFCFVGIEGAVMLASHAKKPAYVGLSSIFGFLLALIFYVLVSGLCFGVMSQEELSALPDPSVAYILKNFCGEWAYYTVLITIIVSLLSAWVAWTLVCAQTPYGAAEVKMLPKSFLSLNKKNMPSYGLRASSVLMSLFMLLVCTAPDVYRAALNLTTIMVLPAYFFSGLYLWKISREHKIVQPGQHGSRYKSNFRYMAVGISCSIYCLWCIYAGGLLLFMASSIFYAIGIYFYYLTRRQIDAENGYTTPLFTAGEKVACAIILTCAVISLVLLVRGDVNLSGI